MIIPAFCEKATFNLRTQTLSECGSPEKTINAIFKSHRRETPDLITRKWIGVIIYFPQYDVSIPIC